MKHLSIDPRVVGGTYYSSYWHQRYTVLSIDHIGGWMPRYTVKWQDGRVTTHATAWDAKDRVVSPFVVAALALANASA